MPGIVIVGSGLAGYNLVRELRRLDAKVPITMLCAGSGDSYSKPMLSGAMSHGQTPDDLVLASMESQAKFLGIKIHAKTSVDELLPETNQLVCSRRLKIEYSSLVLATGASPLQPPLLGNAAKLVSSVNTLEDFRRWYAAVSVLPSETPVVILGSGHIAVEFACELVAMGKQPHIVGPDAWPLQSILPDQVGKELHTGLENSGIEFHLGQTALRMDLLPSAPSEGSGLRYAVTLSDGSVLQAGAVLAAIGMEPNVELAEQAGIATRKGVLVNRSLQTSLRDVYALGDVAEIDGLYLPYVTPLIAEAKVLASVLLGQPAELQMNRPLVHVKCPLHPVVACPPLRPVKGEWEFEIDSRGAAAFLRSDSGVLEAFALTRERVQDRFALLASMHPVWN